MTDNRRRVGSILFAAALAAVATLVDPVHAADRVCIGDRCAFPTLAAALAAAPAGAVVTLTPGVYEEAAVIDRDNLTIKAAGAHLKGRAVEGKAALVVRASGVTIEGLRCSGVRVPDGNGACVRYENAVLTLRNVHFHDSEMGILGGGDLLIEDSVIERNGRAGGSLGHNVYASGRQLAVRRSRIVAAANAGHEIKSRAAKTMIEESVIASRDSADSRSIDAPNGGQLIVRNSVLQKGPSSTNADIIGFGLERTAGSKGDHAINEIIFEDNIVIIDRAKGSDVLHVKDATSQVIRGNVLVGGSSFVRANNVWHPNRDAAALGPYPELPAPGAFKASR